MDVIRVWFYNPTGDAEGIFNKLVAFADPPFSHCEMQFSDSHACSIYMGSTVVMKKREFDQNNYTLISLPANIDAVQRAYDICWQQQKQSIKFSSMQMLSCLKLWPSKLNENSTFCSKLIVGVLIDAEILPTTTHRAITPSALYRLLKGGVTDPQHHTGTCNALDFMPTKSALHLPATPLPPQSRPCDAIDFMPTTTPHTHTHAATRTDDSPSCVFDFQPGTNLVI